MLYGSASLVHLKAGILFAMESSSASTKRTRPLGIGNPTICCLVDGCAADLSKCRDYHRRHKVCELHSKTPKVTIAGQEQRFCQQCSRFHSLEEFDEGKRSCRKRLDGHNRRRRKPQAEPLSMNGGRFFPNHQGSEYMNMRVPQLFPGGSSSWGNAMKGENNESGFFNFHPQMSFQRRQGKQFFPIMEGGGGGGGGGGASTEASMCCHSRKMCAPDELNQVVNTSRALSLLSSSSPCHQAACIDPHQHSLILHYGDPSAALSSYPCSLQPHHPTTSSSSSPSSPSSLMLPNAPHPALLLHSQESSLFHTRPEAPPDHHPPTHHTLSFSWD